MVKLTKKERKKEVLFERHENWREVVKDKHKYQFMLKARTSPEKSGFDDLLMITFALCTFIAPAAAEKKLVIASGRKDTWG